MSRYPSIFESDNENEEVRGQISGGIFAAFAHILEALPFKLITGVILSIIAMFAYKKLTAPIEKFDNE